jgi:NTP pyrophosphatase (non-canonical NTP hydrolase)
MDRVSLGRVVDEMTNIFEDQKRFMLACDQKVGEFKPKQYLMYVNLIKEEWHELKDAVKSSDRVEQLDALIDLLVVTTGALHSMGVDAESAWNEVMRTNFAKIDPETGKVNKRKDGKILKPEGWTKPNLESFIKDLD